MARRLPIVIRINFSTDQEPKVKKRDLRKHRRIGGEAYASVRNCRRTNVRLSQVTARTRRREGYVYGQNKRPQISGIFCRITCPLRIIRLGGRSCYFKSAQLFRQLPSKISGDQGGYVVYGSSCAYRSERRRHDRFLWTVQLRSSRAGLDPPAAVRISAPYAQTGARLTEHQFINCASACWTIAVKA
jgi:hypothetical protein